MGWYWCRYDKKHNETFDEWVRREYPLGSNYEYVGRGYLTKMSEYYAPVKNKTTGEISCVVAMVKFSGSGWNKEVGIKFMDETMGPCIANCPKAVLDIIEQSKPLNQWAEKWRKKCWENLANKKQAQKITNGAVIKFKEEISFTNGHKGDTFQVVKKGNKTWFRGVFQYLDGEYYTSGGYKIRNWKAMEFEQLNIVL